MPSITDVTLYSIDLDDPITAKIVSYWEAPFSYEIAEDGPSRSITYHVPEDDPDRDLGPIFVDRLKGVSAYSTPPFNFPNPHQYPGNPGVVCKSARLVSLIGPSRPSPQGQKGRYARITADYAVSPWDVLGSEFADLFGVTVPWSWLDIHIASEEYSVEETYTRDGDTTYVKRFRQTVPVINYTFRRTMLPSPVDYTTVLTGLTGAINDDVFFGAAAGTLFFETFSMTEEDRDPAGNRVFTFSLSIKWRPYSWNWALKPGTARDWGEVTDSGGNKPYDEVSFVPILMYGLA